MLGGNDRGDEMNTGYYGGLRITRTLKEKRENLGEDEGRLGNLGRLTETPREMISSLASIGQIHFR